MRFVLKKYTKAFELIELTVVIVVLGIIFAFAVPAFINAKQEAQDKEARTNLELIQDAEKMYRLERQGYAECSGTGDCNDVLDLDLTPSGYWAYSVPTGFVDNTVLPPKFCAQAVHGTRSWHIDQDDMEANKNVCQAEAPSPD
ncbi:MAG: type II secretion system protein [Candidatus Omnitrophota bacterium]|jgi:type II secretory pathway pseudopilin PulG